MLPKDILSTIFGFKQDAPLRRFIQKASGTSDEFFTLGEILSILKKVISSEGLYDERNPSIILCSEELEVALNQKAMHVSQVRAAVMDQLVSGQPGLENRGNEELATGKRRSYPITTDADTNYELNPSLLRVFHTMEGLDRTKNIFSFRETVGLLSAYILKNREKLFDLRNIHVCLVEGDQLGEAFQVKAFHRSQVRALLQAQMRPKLSSMWQANTAEEAEETAHNLAISTINLQNLDIDPEGDDKGANTVAETAHNFTIGTINLQNLDINSQGDKG